MHKHRIMLAISGLALLLLAACTPVARVPESATSEAAATPDLTADDGEGAIAGADATTIAILGSLSYTGLFETTPITLTNGVYTYTDAGSGDQFQVRLLEEFAVYGDLDGDDRTDALAVLELDPPGSGRFTYLAPVRDVWNTPTTSPAVELGGNVQLQSITLADGQVVADYIGHGPGDGDCCPSYNRRNTYAWQEGALVEVSNEELGKAEAGSAPPHTASAPDELAAITDEDAALFQAAGSTAMQTRPAATRQGPRRVWS